MIDEFAFIPEPIEIQPTPPPAWVRAIGRWFRRGSK